MDFELMQEINVEETRPGLFGTLCSFRILREKSTDVLWVWMIDNNIFKEMLNPTTGLPLTYKYWCEHYKKV